MSSEIAISWPGVNPARSIARISASSAASLVSNAGQNPPSSATPCNRPRSAMIAPAARYTSAVHSSAWSNEDASGATTMKSWISTRLPACAPPPKIWISGSGIIASARSPSR